MPALREAISRFFNPPPGHEAVVIQRQAERLETAAAELSEHHDTFAELVRNVQASSAPKRARPSSSKPSKRARGR